jgi:3'(2'), 5'-bisphosphate nucleotidase
MRPEEIGSRLADIVEEASRLILPLWRSGLAVKTKADESPVTVADQQAERLILARLAESFSDIPVISEEDASEFGAPDRIGPRFFLVDPLDGTKAFVRDDANFTVNIGLIENGRPTVGAVAAPASGETWFTDGLGARKRSFGEATSHPIRTRPAGADPLALISHTMSAEALADLRTRYGFSRTQPMDSSIKLCRIAEGAADIYPRHGPTMEWDIAAGQAILEAAGGSVLTPDGSSLGYGKAAEGFRNGGFVARGAASTL